MITGTASHSSEAIIHSPDLMDQKAILTALEEVIISSEFRSMEDFLGSFSGVFEENKKLYLQIGGVRNARRKYVSASIVGGIPGCESFDEDGDEWWSLRGEAPHTKKLLLYTASISQELLAEQLFDYLAEQYLAEHDGGLKGLQP